MITPDICSAKFGLPKSKQSERFVLMWDVPAELEIGVIPKKIYCHQLMVAPLTKAFRNLIDRGFVSELKTWDGCYNPRLQRGSRTQWSIHSWALAIDVNAAWNGLGAEPKLSAGFVKCFTDAGFDWGGIWKRKDGMHFQLSSV
ncbi:MAG: M15 family metallopeptidase [Ferruginibacter sp.]